MRGWVYGRSQQLFTRGSRNLVFLASRKMVVSSRFDFSSAYEIKESNGTHSAALCANEHEMPFEPFTCAHTRNPRSSLNRPEYRRWRGGPILCLHHRTKERMRIFSPVPPATSCAEGSRVAVPEKEMINTRIIELAIKGLEAVRTRLDEELAALTHQLKTKP